MVFNLVEVFFLEKHFSKISGVSRLSCKKNKPGLCAAMLAYEEGVMIGGVIRARISFRKKSLYNH